MIHSDHLKKVARTYDQKRRITFLEKVSSVSYIHPPSGEHVDHYSVYRHIKILYLLKEYIFLRGYVRRHLYLAANTQHLAVCL